MKSIKQILKSTLHLVCTAGVLSSYAQDKELYTISQSVEEEFAGKTVTITGYKTIHDTTSIDFLSNHVENFLFWNYISITGDTIQDYDHMSKNYFAWPLSEQTKKDLEIIQQTFSTKKTTLQKNNSVPSFPVESAATKQPEKFHFSAPLYLPGTTTDTVIVHGYKTIQQEYRLFSWDSIVVEEPNPNPTQPPSLTTIDCEKFYRLYDSLQELLDARIEESIREKLQKIQFYK